MTRTAVAVLVGAGILAGSAYAAGATSVAFSASYAGKAVVKVNGNAATISANGTGTSSVLGAGKIAGKGTGDTSTQPCPLWGGTGTMSGAKGTVKFTVAQNAKACVGSDQKQVTVSGQAKVTGGTGKFAKARGTLKFNGKYNRGTGAFSVKFSGSLTL